MKFELDWALEMLIDVNSDGYLGRFLGMTLRRGHAGLVGKKERMSSKERKSPTTTVRLCWYLIYIISGEGGHKPEATYIIAEGSHE